MEPELQHKLLLRVVTPLMKSQVMHLGELYFSLLAQHKQLLILPMGDIKILLILLFMQI